MQQSTLREIFKENYSSIEQRLERETRLAIAKSYAPYSNFPVGCALMLNNGSIVHGANQENAAYPSGLCAERVAMFSASAQYPRVIITHLAVAVAPQFKHTPFPCGSCLQVMAELEQRQKKPLKIHLLMQGKMYIAEGVKNFLPFAFEKGNLKA